MLKVLKGLLLGGISHAGRETWTYTQGTEDALFKTAYGKHNAMAFNQRSPLYGRIKKKTTFKGKEMVSSIRLSYGGGRGSGSLPRASRALYKQITLKTKKLYHRLSVDNETFEASKSSLGAFVRMAKEPMEVARIAFSNLLERQIVLGDLAGTGKLGTSKANVTTIVAQSASNPTGTAVALADDTIMESFEEGDVVDVYQGQGKRVVAEILKIAGTTLHLGSLEVVAALGNAKADVYLQTHLIVLYIQRGYTLVL